LHIISIYLLALNTSTSRQNKLRRFLFTVCSLLSASILSAQNTLPEITVKNLNEKIIVSWLNTYKKPIQNILIQRSFDSLKNYTTIGTVLNPQNTENGYPDNMPPYNKMYYRVTIIFEGGAYEIGKAFRPVKEIIDLPELDITAIPKSKQPVVIPEEEASLSKSELAENIQQLNFDKQRNNKKDSISIKVIEPKRIIETAYPSNRIFTSKQNSIVIQIAEARFKKYTIKFYDENEQLALELKKIKEDYLILEKSNFGHAGWFRFEIFEDGKLFEKNKVFIAKDKPKPNG